MVPGHDPGHRFEDAAERFLTPDDVLQVETGSLYPALRRLEEKGWIRSRWDMSEQHNRELKFYELTAKGRTQLKTETENWKRLTELVGLILKGTLEGAS